MIETIAYVAKSAEKYEHGCEQPMGISLSTRGWEDKREWLMPRLQLKAGPSGVQDGMSYAVGSQ
eukprot:1158893-Pelagomonas_calceolata.AAC.9